MKKLFAILFTVALAATFTGCMEEDITVMESDHLQCGDCDTDDKGQWD